MVDLCRLAYFLSGVFDDKTDHKEESKRRRGRICIIRKPVMLEPAIRHKARLEVKSIPSYENQNNLIKANLHVSNTQYSGADLKHTSHTPEIFLRYLAFLNQKNIVTPHFHEIYPIVIT